MNINQCNFSGVCVKPPKTIRSQNGIDYCIFSISMTTNMKNISGDGWENKSSIVDFVVFRPKLKYVQLAVKLGSIVSVEAVYAPTEIRGQDGKLKMVPLFKVNDIEVIGQKEETKNWHASDWI